LEKLTLTVGQTQFYYSKQREKLLKEKLQGQVYVRVEVRNTIYDVSRRKG
jgi:hypothetical protein